MDVFYKKYFPMLCELFYIKLRVLLCLKCFSGVDAWHPEGFHFSLLLYLICFSRPFHFFRAMPFIGSWSDCSFGMQKRLLLFTPHIYKYKQRHKICLYFFTFVVSLCEKIQSSCIKKIVAFIIHITCSLKNT